MECGNSASRLSFLPWCTQLGAAQLGVRKLQCRAAASLPRQSRAAAQATELCGDWERGLWPPAAHAVCRTAARRWEARPRICRRCGQPACGSCRAATVPYGSLRAQENSGTDTDASNRVLNPMFEVRARNPVYKPSIEPISTLCTPCHRKTDLSAVIKAMRAIPDVLAYFHIHSGCNLTGPRVPRPADHLAALI